MATETVLDHVYRSLSGLPDGQVRPRAEELAAYYGVSLQTIYRWAHKKGLRWRKEKATKGKTKVPESVIMSAAALQLAARRTNNQIPLPACDAKEILEDSGIEVNCSTGWLLNLMRQRNVAAKDLLRPSPHVTLLSKHPNHVWQFDVTNCIQYFLDQKGLGERDEEMELYKNKIVKTAKKIRKELLRYVVVDHCTGAFYFRYFYASGERARDGADFFYEAMRPKDELIERIWNGESKEKVGKFRFHGVPFILVADRGSIMAAKENQNLFDALRIELKLHLPGNPRAKGAVEGLMKIINRFEARLKLKKPSSLEELNSWALDWCIYYNATKDMRGVAPRSELWAKITPEQLRLCPDEALYRRLIRRPTFRAKANGACLIRVDNRFYKVPDTNAANKWVYVSINAYEHPCVDVHFNDHVWLLEPIETDEYGRLLSGVEYGEFHSPRHTETQKAKKEMEKVAENWGLKWKGTGDKRRAEAPPLGHETPLQVFGHQASKVGNLSYLVRKGTDLEIRQPEMPDNKPMKTDAIEISREIVSKRIPILQFFRKLKEATGGPIPKKLNQAIRARYGASIEISEAEEVIRQIQEGRWPASGETGQAQAL
ncbi:MAG: transposase [Deltaproteobacteria bacterium]|nr:transposase [Deltaproteobacteria bacterium]